MVAFGYAVNNEVAFQAKRAFGCFTRTHWETKAKSQKPKKL